MSQSTTRQWPRLSFLLFAAGYASASLTLTNFEKIPDTVKSSSCQSAYDTALADCKIEDFTNNRVCSKKCRDSIDEVEDAIQEECEGVIISNSNSLLYRALKGQLVDVLCQSDGSDDGSDDDTATTTAVASETHQKQVIVTSTVSKKTSTSAETTSMPEQTTSLVLAGDEPTDVAESAVSSSAKPTETSSGSGRGGDPFANNTSAGASLAVGYTTLVISTLLCMVAVM